MNRQQKALIVEELKKSFLDSQASFLVGVKGLTVAQIRDLRSGLRKTGGALKVAKARLMKIAVSGESGISDLSPFFKDQVGLVFASEKFTDVAKVLFDFSKENKSLNMVVGYLDHEIINKEKISWIASLPPKEVLLSQVCGTIKAPISGLVITLKMVVLKFLVTLKQIGRQ